MHRSTGAAVRRPPLRRIPWRALREEREAADQVWSCLPPESGTREDVERFLRQEGLAMGMAGAEILYAYADGPREPGSPVQAEWYLEFRFADRRLAELTVDKRLVGP